MNNCQKLSCSRQGHVEQLSILFYVAPLSERQQIGPHENDCAVLQAFCVMNGLDPDRRAEIGSIAPARITDPNDGNIAFGLDPREKRSRN
jgi:hypothetical protein